MIKPHLIVKRVTDEVQGLSDASYRELGKDAGCFSATQDGRRIGITVYLDFLPSRVWFGVYMPAVWEDGAIVAYIVRQMGGTQ